MGKIRISVPYALFVAIFILFLIAIVILADRGIAAWVFTASTLFSYGDKMGHLILMGLFSFLLNSALYCHTLSVLGFRIRLGSLVAAFLVVTEEFSQAWVPTRHFELSDLAFDLIGIYLFGLLASRNLKIRTKERRS